MLALLLVALALGLSDFAASIAIVMSGADSALSVRIALAFGLFEAGMPIIGLVVGRQVAHALGSHAELVGGGLLVVTGAYIRQFRPARTRMLRRVRSMYAVAACC